MRRKAIAALLAAALLLTLLPDALAYTVDETGNTGARSVVSTVIKSAVVKNAQPGKLNVEITLQEDAAENNNVYALVMDTASYTAVFDKGPYPKGLGSGNYANFSGDLNTDGKNSYAIAAGKTGAGRVLTIPLVDYSENDPAAAANKALRVPAVNQTAQDYWLSYTLVVFDANAKTGNQNYYVDQFDLDSEGYVRTPSYMVRYQANNPAQGSGSVDKLPAKVITRADTYDALPDTTLSGANAALPYAAPTAADAAAKGVPYRVGYAFDGWDPEAKSEEPAYTTGRMSYPKPADDPAKLYQIYDLYAVWSAIPVTFDGERCSAPGGQVGVPYNMTAQTLAEPSDARTAKTYSVTEARWELPDGTLAEIDKPGLLDGKKMPAGLKIAMVGSAGNQWNITGTPTVDSDKPIVLTVEVKDNGNATTDTIAVTIPVIKKGVQGKPEVDWNTALQGRVVTSAEEEPEEPVPPDGPPELSAEAGAAAREVGQIIGFYSPNDGAPDYKGKTYEYVPAAVYDAKRAELGLGAEDEPTDGQQAELDKLWRTVELADGAEEDGPDWTGYGRIEAAQPGDWVKGGLPAAGPKPLQVTELEVGADFYVRFRANETYVASDYVTVNTSGAVGGGAGGGGPSVSFNLAGGALPKKDGESGEDVDFTFVYDGLSTGETVEIPAVEPLREGYTFAGWTDGANVYRYDPEAETPVSVAAVDGPLTLAAKWDATTQGFCSVVFYDWDGTLLGSRIVPKGGSLLGDHKTPTQRGDGANQAPMPPEYELLWDVNGNGEYDFVGNNNAGNDAANKMGYTFAGWVDNATGYSVPNVPASTARGQKIPEEDLRSLTNITESMILKAAYHEDGETIGPAATTRRYLISYTPFTMVSGMLQTTVTVRRPQNARRAVEGETYLRITLQPNQRGQTKVDIPLGRTDVEVIQFTMPPSAASNYQPTAALTLTIFDSSGVARSADVTIDAKDIVAH